MGFFKPNARRRGILDECKIGFINKVNDQMISCCGINHKTAPVELREKIAFQESQLEASLKSFKTYTGFEEAVILSTCNRTEIYTTHIQPSSENSENTVKIIDWLAEHHRVSKQTLTHHLYSHQHHSAVVKHAMRVASGLDSLLIGETQIVGQLKSAVNIAEKTGFLGKKLKDLFEHAFQSAKKIRTQTNIGAHSLSLGQVVVKLAKSLFENIADKKVLMIGAGEVINSAAKYLQTHDIQQFWIANRTYSNAEKLYTVLNSSHTAHASKIDILSLQEIPAILPKVDILISAIHHVSPVIGKGMVETAIKSRKHKPVLMIDLAVPRNIESEIKSLEDVYLYNMDDLQGVLNDNKQKKQLACIYAEELIETQTQEYLQKFYA